MQFALFFISLENVNKNYRWVGLLFYENFTNFNISCLPELAISKTIALFLEGQN
jgi:hypothetical protein